MEQLTIVFGIGRNNRELTELYTIPLSFECRVLKLKPTVFQTGKLIDACSYCMLVRIIPG
jgi:hypothetical protein